MAVLDINPTHRVQLLRRMVVDETTGCWLWTGSISERGYGYFHATSGRRFYAHRRSYEVFVGPIDKPLVCHHCDNRRCINPLHLFTGTNKDNSDDRDRKGRNVNPPCSRGEKSPSAKLSNKQVDDIRSSTLNSTKLAEMYGIDAGYIRAIKRGKRRSQSV
jgi:hypothetical protein